MIWMFDFLMLKLVRKLEKTRYDVVLGLVDEKMSRPQQVGN